MTIEKIRRPRSSTVVLSSRALILCTLVAALSGCSTVKRVFHTMIAPLTSPAPEPVPALEPALAGEPREHRARVASIQYPLEGNKTSAEVLEKMESFVVKAKLADADVIVFPELVALDAWPADSLEPEAKIFARLAAEFTPALFERAAYWSSTYGALVLVGSAPRLVNGRIFNSALVAFPEGKTVIQDKINLADWERQLGWSPGRRINFFDTSWGRAAILFGRDLGFPETSVALTREKPRFLLAPTMAPTQAAWTRAQWSARGRAVEQQTYVIVSMIAPTPSSPRTVLGESEFLIPPSLATGEPQGQAAMKVANQEIVFGTLRAAKRREPKVAL